MDIHGLARQGQSQRAIASSLGISRNTVTKHLKSTQWPEYTQRPQYRTKLEPYLAYLHQRIDAARPHWLPATVLMRGIQARGYTGGIAQLRRYIAPLKTSSSEPVVRFETEPGQQMQIDFTTIRRGKQALKAFVAILGNSRASFVRFYCDEKTGQWLDGLIGAFEFFGGVPREILCDNAKALVIERDAYGDGKHRFNAQLLELARTYGFRLKTCQPYRAKTKGKVERFNHYLKHSFVLPLAVSLKEQGLILDTQVANAKIGAWLHDVAHRRQHQTTGETPAERLLKEIPYLLPLPVIAPLTAAARHEPVSLPVGIVVPQHSMQVYEQFVAEDI